MNQPAHVGPVFLFSSDCLASWLWEQVPDLLCAVIANVRMAELHGQWH